MKSFHIQTLGDQINMPRSRNLGQIVEILTGGTTILEQLFPALFGSQRRALVADDWAQLVPGSGYWTSQLRKYLARHIFYDTDLKNMPEFTRYFIHENMASFSNYPNLATGLTADQFNQVVNRFYQILESEAGQTSGIFPPSSPVITADIFKWGGVALLLGLGFAFLKTPKKRRSR